MPSIEFTSRAFITLESLPQSLGFGLVRLSELLRENSKLGVLIRIRNAPSKKYRQLILRRTHRLICEIDEIEDRIYVVAIQHCRQKLPSPRDLKRDEARDE